MFQKYFTNTIYAKAIKYILTQTPLPLYKTITSDEYIYEGCTYIYKHHLLRCTKSGYFIGIFTNNYTDDYLYVSEKYPVTDDSNFLEKRIIVRDDDGKVRYLFKKVDFTVTDDILRQYLLPFSSFKIIEDYNFGEFKPGITQYIRSNTNYYDSETHRYLGDYLRALRDIKGIDLMSLYNCFEYKFVNNVNLLTDKLVEANSSKNKVTLIPIKFNKTYTIAIDCKQPVRITSIIYKDMLLKDKDTNEFISNKLKDTIHKYNNLQFSVPITYKIEEESKDILKYEKYLYLAIQLPVNNDSSIVVLEGDYTTSADQYISSIESVEKLPDATISRIFKTRLSLLRVNDKLQRPFADKLLQYLLQNTIDNRELNDKNITKIQKLINYNPKYHGNWNNVLRYTLYNGYMNLNNRYDLNKYDILGFVDSEVEEEVLKGRIKYGR